MALGYDGMIGQPESRPVGPPGGLRPADSPSAPGGRTRPGIRSMSLLDMLYEGAVRLLTHEFTADQLADPSERQSVHNILVAKIPALRAAGRPLVGSSRTPPPPGDDHLWYQAVPRPRVER